MDERQEKTKSEKQLTTRRDKKMPIWLLYILSFIGFIYLLNPTAGILELIPDNLPIVGNLDEGAAALLVWQGLNEFLNSRKDRKS